MKKVYVFLVCLALLMGGVIVAKADEQQEFYAQVEGFLLGFLGVQPVLYSNVSEESFQVLTGAASRYLRLLLVNLGKRDLEIKAICKHREELGLGEAWRMLVLADRKLSEGMVRWFGSVLDSLSSSDRAFVVEHVLPRSKVGWGLAGPVRSVESVEQSVKEHPIEMERGFDRRCSELSGRYEYVVRFQGSADSFVETRFVRRVTDESAN